MSTTTAPALPRIVSRAEWLAARKQLLVEEKALTRARDALAEKRRRLPMVRIEKDYVFATPAGSRSLPELFAGRSQLYVHHFMWNEETQTHCPGCSKAADLVFDNPELRAFLAARNVTFVAISRAPLAQIEARRAEKGWTFPWYSSAGTDFNHDFHVTLDERRAPIEMNYRNKAELLAAGMTEDQLTGDFPVQSVFLRDGDTVYHTYSTFQRGSDQLFTPYNYLDLTPYGRQEEWEDSPAGWPQRPIGLADEPVRA
ncbi:DUF899 domain-containing protein [Opitutus terrae]|uniref:Thioredoxin domain-containing protein n=1 Tax=Opitutus terrae (strain DSM 11246 / JCM 15787 / PB90-1) TaxID=452637 RepID=B1ZNH4_OPITP|nr:DUF899 domain-containing protein [Opitutus terrae]ACB74408.1 protein of unknown function DUF899 thioredoxin family protein [Opitutus terrae PB90-1]